MLSNVDDDDIEEEYCINLVTKEIDKSLYFYYVGWMPDDIRKLFIALADVMNGFDGPFQEVYLKIICDSEERRYTYECIPLEDD